MSVYFYCFLCIFILMNLEFEETITTTPISCFNHNNTYNTIN